MPDAINYNPFALLNPGPLPPRIPNSFGPPPGTIMPNNFDRVSALLAEQAAAYAAKGQANPNPFTAEQIFQQFPGPSNEQKAATQEQRIAKILSDQQAGAAAHGQTLNQPFTAPQIMQLFPANVNPLPTFGGGAAGGSGGAGGGASQGGGAYQSATSPFSLHKFNTPSTTYSNADSASSMFPNALESAKGALALLGKTAAGGGGRQGRALHPTLAAMLAGGGGQGGK